MRQESGGQEDVISWAGAMGLMQVMPETYAGLRDRYSLGDDPFDPRNNILAGTAYLREMYDRFGAPGFLAAYNAGPNRVDRYLNNGTPLPEETVNYVAAIAPRLGPGTPLSGPLAVYAGGAPVRLASVPSGCNPDAAYDPSRPCAPMPVAVAPITLAPSVDCDPDAAFDPSRRCAPLPTPVAVAPAPVFEPPPRPVPSYAPPRAARPMQEAMAQPVGYTAAYATLSSAEAAAETARSQLPDLLRLANVDLPATTPLGTQVAFRAQLTGLPAKVATEACAKLTARGLPCRTVPPRS
jgi:hypothetical protein